jgi:hypothetical protein
LDDEVIEEDADVSGTTGDGNRGAAIGVDARPLDSRNSDRFVNGYGEVIGGVKRLDLAAGRSLVDRELE